MTPPEIIAKLEAVAEGSWELDRDITLALRLKGRIAINEDGAEYERLGDDQHFTRSLDAALTLVPEGWDWVAGGGPNSTNYAQLNRLDESGGVVAVNND